MMSSEHLKIFSTFLLFLSLIRLWNDDLIGFFIFLLFSFLFYFSKSLESKIDKETQEAENRKRTFSRLSSPKVVFKNEGNSEITTLVVPSLSFFNEMNNDNI